ncbi:hypothetical protein J7481_19575 [Labrenzia sp. R4_2]|uniref:hypothetical protein n=1 Tax=Labrenzia sp. R4_2 TaxID=2821107 RepID=UPI001AD9A8FC|nr:hypothetical protein [Labrenzia sp. R4_2]MBO9421717.1 hypothetical protein [Labrenzia sp. R4_2]
MIDWLITFLQDFKQAKGALSSFELIIALSAIFIPLTSFFGILMIGSYRFARRRYMADIKEAEEIRHKLAAREDSIKDLKSEIEKSQLTISALEAKGAEFFLSQLAREARDGNFEREVHLSESYLADQKEALSRAFRTLMADAIENAALEGAPGYANARLYALAGLVLRKDDIDLRELADQLRAAEAAAGGGATVRLKTQDNVIPSNLDALATAYEKAWLAGRYRLAMELAKHGLRAALRTAPIASDLCLGWRQSQTVSTQFSGYPLKALESAKALLLEQEQLNGKDHPNTLSTRYLIAACLHDAGEAEKALVAAQALLPDQERINGRDHQHTLVTRYLIASCLHITGAAEKALVAAEAFLPDQERVNGKDHPHTLTTRYLIVSSLNATGEAEKAMEAAKALLPDQERVNGKDHPNTLSTRHLIALCLQGIGLSEEALEAAEALLPDEERVNGEDHPHTLATRFLIASCLNDVGAPEKALEAAQSLLPDQEKVSGKVHPITLSTRYLFADCLYDTGAVERALEIARELLVEFPPLVGELHPRTLKVKTLAATCLLDLNQSEEAEEIHATVMRDWQTLGAKDTHPDVQRALQVANELARQDCKASAKDI